MCRISLLITILYLSLHYTYQCKNTDAEITEAEITEAEITEAEITEAEITEAEITDAETTDPTDTFDILIFSQEWPVTACRYWKSDLNGTNCIFPKKKNQWSVHGIWPTKFGASRDWCNHSWPFDPEQITSIRSDLEQAWIQVYDEYDRYGFWRHEWNKHGTCATELKSFNSELKYFSKGIEWNHKYSISDMLAAAKIFPDDTKERNPEEFVDAVKAITHKTAKMGCYCINKVLYVQEIRICFDKQLNLIDCKHPAVDDCCRTSKSVIFPANG